MKALILFVFIALVAIAEGAQARKLTLLANNPMTVEADFGSVLFNYVEAFENIMPCGFAPWNIPVLSPFKLPKWNFNFSKEYYSVAGDITNLVVTGLNNARFIKFSYNSTLQKLSFDTIYPEFQLLSEYNVNAWALLAGYNARASGNGPLNWKFKDVRSIGEFIITKSDQNPNGLVMTDFNMNFFIGDVIPNNWNYQWNISFNKFFNRWVRDFILMYAEQIQFQLDDIFDSVVLPEINNALENVSMDKLIAFFMQQTQLLNASVCTSV